MSKTYTQLNPNTDTFYQWLTMTNELVSAFANVVTTTTTSAGDTTTGNAFVSGIFGANTLTVTNIRGGNVTTSEAMTVTSNIAFSGSKADSTSNTYTVAANVYTISNTFTVGANSTVNSIAVRGNGTVSNVTVTGTTITLTGNLVIASNTSFASNVALSGSATVADDLTVSTVTMITSNSATLSGTSAQLIDSFSGSTYRGGKYVISLKDTANSDYQMTELLVLHDGTTALTTEYATLRSIANNMLTISANVSGSTVRVYATPTVGASAVKLSKTMITV